MRRRFRCLRERQAGCAVQAQRAAGDRKRHLHGGGVRVDVGDRDAIAGRRGEDERQVLVGVLAARQRVDRRVVHGGDVDGHAVGAGQRSAAARAALIGGGDGQHRRAVKIGDRREREAVECGVDVGRGAGEGHRSIAAAGAAAEGQAWRCRPATACHR